MRRRETGEKERVERKKGNENIDKRKRREDGPCKQKIEKKRKKLSVSFYNTIFIFPRACLNKGKIYPNPNEERLDLSISLSLSLPLSFVSKRERRKEFVFKVGNAQLLPRLSIYTLSIN